MTSYRLTPPLTALSICALIAWGALSPAQAQNEGVSDMPAYSQGAEDAPVIPAEEPAATITVTEGAAETADSAEDMAEDMDDMPPMATANQTPVKKPEAVITPSIQQLGTIDMTTSGPRAAVGDAPMVAVTRGNGAADSYVDPAGDTHPVLKLTPDKSSLIRLPRAAASVIVGNEAHVNVLIDTPMTLVAVPRQPGASYFTVLDNQGRVIMQRHVIVAAPAEDYIRIRRSCSGAGAGCEHTSVFYCPDGMCHPVTTRQTPGSTPQQGPIGMAPVMGGPTGMGGLGNTDAGGYESYTPPPDFGGGMPFPFFIPFNFGGGNAE